MKTVVADMTIMNAMMTMKTVLKRHMQPSLVEEPAPNR
jgi:hypothetical protein